LIRISAFVFILINNIGFKIDHRHDIFIGKLLIVLLKLYVLNHDLIQLEFEQLHLVYLYIHWVFCDQSINCHLFLLANSVRSSNCLYVLLRIEVRFEHYHCVSCSQVYPDSSWPISYIISIWL
jgi:hypothetical protein